MKVASEEKEGEADEGRRPSRAKPSGLIREYAKSRWAASLKESWTRDCVPFNSAARENLNHSFEDIQSCSG